MPPAKKQRFDSMELREANKHCTKVIRISGKQDFVFDNCPACTQRVGLHCAECKIQVTGCLCVEYDRFGNDEGWRRAVDRYGEEMARERARAAGLWVPEKRNLR